MVNEDDAIGARAIGCAQDGAEIAGIAHAFERDEEIAGKIIERGCVLAICANHGLRIVAFRDLGEQRFIHLDHAHAARIGFFDKR